MRNLRRPAAQPPMVSLAGKAGYDYAQSQVAGTAPRDKFMPHWRSPDVRGVIRAMCGSACAYCTDKIGRTGEDVEHYRPKNLYWFVAYSPHNYVSSCRRCNSSRKGNRFPLEPNATRAASVDRFARERRLLLDPVKDDVESALQIELTSGRYNWEVNPTAQPKLRLRAAETIKFFGLNRDPELLYDRINAIQDFLRGIESTDATVRSRARRRASRYEPHGAAIRSVLQQLNPALMPEPRDDTEQHLVKLVQIAKLSATPDDSDGLVARYAIATLWCDPPNHVRKTTIATLLAHEGIIDNIEPLVIELGGSP